MKNEVEAPSLSPEQQKLAAEHVSLVGMHMKKRVRMPKIPTRDREYDDLFQEGCVALVRAARRYNPKRNGPFASYALPRVRGAIFSALNEYFDLVHVPTRTSTKIYHPGRQQILMLSEELIEGDKQHLIEDNAAPELIRHAIRRRFERAVHAALDDLRSRSWPRRNPLAIMERIAAERVLISEEIGRTPLRQIAREAGVSSSRASAYENKLIEVIGEYLSRDAHLKMLVRFAADDRAGFDGVLDHARRMRLAGADLEDFDHRFAEMPAADRAKWMYELIEKTCLAPAEVARNLYRMVMKHENIPDPIPDPRPLTPVP